MKKTNVVLIILFIFGTFGCGSKKASKPKKIAEVTKTPVKKKIITETSTTTPSWYERPPKESGYYFFAGVGKGKKPRSAKNGALADIFSQIVYMVNASITSNSTFEQYVEENEKEARKNSSIYKKVRAKGEAVIENFEEVERSKGEETGSDGKKRYVVYTLAKIPKSEVEKARKRAEKEKLKRRKNPMGIFAVAVFPNKQVEEIDSIKSQLENIYKTMGFNVKAVDIEFNANSFKSSGRTVKFLKSKAYPKIKKALICVIKPSRVRKENLGKMKVTSILGDMTIREIDLATGEVISSNTLNAKGVSMRKGPDAVEDAFRKLMKNLTQELLEEGSDEKGDEAF